MTLTHSITSENGEVNSCLSSMTDRWGDKRWILARASGSRCLEGHFCHLWVWTVFLWFSETVHRHTPPPAWTGLLLLLGSSYACFDQLTVICFPLSCCQRSGLSSSKFFLWDFLEIWLTSMMVAAVGMNQWTGVVKGLGPWWGGQAGWCVQAEGNEDRHPGDVLPGAVRMDASRAGPRQVCQETFQPLGFEEVGV